MRTSFEDIKFVKKSDKKGYSYYKHKYGLLHVHIANKYKNIGIQSAVDKNSFFTNWIYDVNPRLSELDVELKSDYIGMNKPITVSTKYGDCTLSARSLLRHLPTIITAVDPKIFLENQAQDIHKEANYSYEKVVYKNAKTNILITCLKNNHGDFNQSPSNPLHITNPAGCPKCARERTEAHNRENSQGWGYKNWDKSAKKSKRFDSFKVYIIFCWDEKEYFYKIGRTYNTVRNRFNCKTAIPYNFYVVEIIEADSALDICNWENHFKNENKIHSYIPSKKFGGETECYSEINIFDPIRKRQLICSNSCK